jgi:DNA-binding beta-propeller fold protein YncE
MKPWCNSKKYSVIAIGAGMTMLLLGSLMACLSRPLPEVITTIKLSQHPRRIAVNANSGVAYVLQENEISVLYRGVLSNTLQMEPNVGDSGVIVAPSQTQEAYVFDPTHHSIWIIDTNQLVTTIQEPDFRFQTYYQNQSIAVNPVTGYIYALNLWDRKEDDETLSSSVLVLSGTQIIARIPVGRRPIDLNIDPRSGLVYVGDAPETSRDYPNMLTVISGTQVIATSDLGRPPGTGGAVKHITIDTHTGKVYVYLSQRLYVLQDFIATDAIQLDASVLQLAYNPVNKRLYAMLVGNEVLVLNTNLDIVKRIVIPHQYPAEGNGNRAMAIDPVRGYVYVGNTQDGTLAVIQDTKIITTLQAGWYTVDIGVDPNTGTVYAINDMSKDVTVIGFPE